MVGTSMPCTETIDGWIPGIDAQPRTPKEEINAPPAVGLLSFGREELTCGGGDET